MNGILAKKLGMTQVFTEQGECVPVTVLEAGPCVVVCHKTEEKDGYTAVQIGFGLKKEQRANKAEIGHFKKAEIAVREHLAEFDVADLEAWPVGKEFGAADFADVKMVNVSGISKGHGFSGAIKRHGFHSGPRSHGTHNMREPGGTSAHSYPGRVFPGKRMPGQYGNKKVTVNPWRCPGPEEQHYRGEERLMASAKLFAATGDFKNDIELPKMFDEEVNTVCMYLHIKAILNNQRQGNAQAKNKSSQNTSAVWVRGAKAHGPKSHDYFEKVNKKVKKIAFHSALAAKAKDGKVLVFEALSFGAPKTKDLLAVLTKAGVEQRNALFVVSEKDANLYLSSNNIPWCRCARVEDVNTYDIVRANNVVISQAALAELEGGR